MLLVIRSHPARIFLFLAGAACAAALAISLFVSPAASVETANEAGAGAQPAGSAGPAGPAGQDCRVVQVALDEGYSISRVEERRLCP